MPPRSSSLTLGLAVAAILGALAFGGAAPALANPAEAQENSLQSAVDGFVAYLKSQTYDAALVAAKVARDNKDTIEAAKTTLNSQLADLRAVLSDQKARVETLASAAAAKVEAWSKSAGFSWASAQRLAEHMLDRFAAWMHSQSPSNDTAETPV